jgi:hypothetical protein
MSQAAWVSAEGPRRSLCRTAAFGQIDGLGSDLESVVVALAPLLPNVEDFVPPAAWVGGWQIDGRPRTSAGPHPPQIARFRPQRQTSLSSASQWASPSPRVRRKLRICRVPSWRTPEATGICTHCRPAGRPTLRNRLYVPLQSSQPVGGNRRAPADAFLFIRR